MPLIRCETTKAICCQRSYKKNVEEKTKKEYKHEKLKDTIWRPEKSLQALSETHDRMLYYNAF